MGAKQIHDQYGKRVLLDAFGSDFNSSPAPHPFGPEAGTARIDGIVYEKIAVEIESRASKQVRGALVDIALYPLPLKLVVLLPVYGNHYTERQCRVILKRICSTESHFEVVTLSGTGSKCDLERDVAIVKDAVQRLTHFGDTSR